MTAAVTILIRQSGDGFYLTGSGAALLFVFVTLLTIIACGALSNISRNSR